MPKKKEFPDMNELVFCTVKRITPFAAWCDLDEYDVEGMIHVSEVAGKWVHDIREFVKPNRQYVAKVVKIDEDKNVVNLSLKRVSKKEEKEKINFAKRQQRAEKILEQVAGSLGKTFDEAYETVGVKIEKKFGDLFEGLEEIRNDFGIMDSLGIPDDWKKSLKEVVEKSFKERETVLKVNLEVKSYAKDGLNRVKSFLKEAEIDSSTIRYISAPKYRLEMKTKNPKVDDKKLNEKLEALSKSAKERQIEFDYEFVKE